MRLARLSLGGAAGILLSACINPDVETLGPQTIHGVVRLSDDSFGLLIYPCVPDQLVSEVVLREVELDPETLAIARSQDLLRERYPEPVDPRELLVSTDVNAAPASPGAKRDVVAPALLDRFNADSDYLTAINPDHFLVIDAFAPDGSEVGVSGTLRSRFAADIGEVSGFGTRPVPLEDLRCSKGEPPAWSVSLP